MRFFLLLGFVLAVEFVVAQDGLFEVHSSQASFVENDSLSYAKETKMIAKLSPRFEPDEDASLKRMDSVGSDLVRWVIITIALLVVVGIFWMTIHYLQKHQEQKNVQKDDAPRWPVTIFIAIASLFCFTVLVTPQYIYGQLLEVSHLMFVLAFLYAIYSVRKAWNKGNTDARVIFFGVLIAFPFILMEMLKNSLLFTIRIQFLYWVELGVLVFLLFQIYLLANHYASSYKRLELLNQGLEKMVLDRTTQLSTVNRVKDRLLSIVTHDIRSPLNSLRGTLNIFNEGYISPEEFRKNSRVIEEDLNKTGLLIENILN